MAHPTKEIEAARTVPARWPRAAAFPVKALPELVLLFSDTCQIEIEAHLPLSIRPVQAQSRLLHCQRHILAGSEPRQQKAIENTTPRSTPG